MQRCVLGESERLEIACGGDAWRLAYIRQAEPLLVYEGDRAGARRIRAGRSSAYALRSVEQLRYDFERDLREVREYGAA